MTKIAADNQTIEHKDRTYEKLKGVNLKKIPLTPPKTLPKKKRFAHFGGSGQFFKLLLIIPAMWMASPYFVTTQNASKTRSDKIVSNTLNDLAVIADKAPGVDRIGKKYEKLSNSTQIVFTLLLAPQNTKRLASMAEQVATPGSKTFHRYLTLSEFTNNFGASLQTIRSVDSWSAKNHLGIISVSKNRLSMEIKGRVGQIEQTFHTKLAAYQTGLYKDEIVNLEPAYINKRLQKSIVGIVGLNDLQALSPTDLIYRAGGKATKQIKESIPTNQPSLRQKTTAAKKLLPQSDAKNILPSGNSVKKGASSLRDQAISPTPTSSCVAQINSGRAGLSINQIANAYDFNNAYLSGNNAAHTTVALIEFAPVRVSDIDHFASCYGLPDPIVKQIKIRGGPGHYNASSELEAELDTEMIVGLAPGVTIDIYEGPDNGGNVTNATAYAVEAAAVNNPNVKVISTSWGGCEQSVGPQVSLAENYLFEQSALEGQTWVAAAGDTGSTDCYGQVKGSLGKQLSVDDPASQPFVTGVGGTTLSLSPGIQQSAWNTTLSSQQPGAGGGGTSILWSMPNYQFDTPKKLNVKSQYAVCTSGAPVLDPFDQKITEFKRQKLCREVPDVSADAGTPMATYCSIGSSSIINGFCSANGWTPIGGTSAAAPIWAALFALADSSAACQVSGPIGFANPALYKIASGTGYASALTDVKTGNNDLIGTDAGYYRAGNGYSPVTGLGTPIAAGAGGTGGLIQNLCAYAATPAYLTDLPVPEVTLLKPDSARMRGGAKIILRGKNFDKATSVYFGNAKALAYRIVSDKEIIAVAPSQKGRVHVRVESASGKSTNLHKNIFTFLTPPVIKKITVNRTFLQHTYQLIIYGNYFYDIKRVRFGQVATKYTVLSSRKILVQIPPGKGRVNIRIITKGGESALSKKASYLY